MKGFIIGCSTLGATVIHTAALLSKTNTAVVRSVDDHRHQEQPAPKKSITIQLFCPPVMDEYEFINLDEDTKRFFFDTNENLIVFLSERYYYHPLWTRPP